MNVLWLQLLLAGVSVLPSFGAGSGTPLSPVAGDESVRLGFSYAMFNGINENDARASIRALATAIARERGLPADTEPHLYRSTRDTLDAIHQGAVNALGITTEEYWSLRGEVPFGGLMFAMYGSDPGETYLVLVHASNPARTLDDLKGGEFAVLRNARMSLAPLWLDLELATRHLPEAAEFFPHWIESNRPSKVLLPVFFRQVTACLINRRTYQSMVELNPQVAKELRVVAESPSYVPALFAMTRRISPEFHDRSIREFSALHLSPAGQQVLTIFQTTRVQQMPETVLASAFDLLARHAELRRARANAASGTPTSVGAPGP